MGVKFRMEFTNAQDTLCVVKFDFSDYNDEAILLFGGARPFVLQEFNSDDDLFKPVRPMQATIEVLASAAGVDLEDFLTDDDQTVKVRFDFGQYQDFWVGYLSQEDIQETWIATNHILTLRADDGIGALKTIPLADGENQITGTYSPYDFIKYAMSNTAVDFLNARICSNLYHTSMTFAANTTGIDQCTIDARTFEQAPGEFDDSYTVIEKINRSWSQTIFQYWGDWFIMRLEELFVPTTTNLVGFQLNKPMIGQRASISRRWDINVGVNELVKPIMPEMLKTVIKPSKETQINFDWEKFSQIVCNESFQSGTRTEEFIGGTGTEKWTVDEWTLQRTSISNPVSSNGVFERRVEYENYKLKDDYIYIGFVVGDNWARSCNVYVTEGDSVDIEFQYKVEFSPGNPRNQIVAVLLLYASDGTKYALNRLRQWVQWTTDGQIESLFLANSIPPTEWTTFVQRYDDNVGVANQPVPKNGYLNFLFYRDVSELNGGGVYYKDFNLEIQSEAERNRRRAIKGDYDKYTITRNVNKNYLETIFLDDAETNVYKGAIYQADGFTLTGDQWFRRRYSSERYTFKRHHAIARWWMNRNYKAKLECNFYGLEWGTVGNTLPIGLMNTVKFVDDAPTKVFAIANLREIDFMSATWAANLIEVYDSQIEGDVPGDTDVHTFDFYYE
jgi:hypothetical protein